MATHPRLVNKQFNSPIGLYSSDNIQEVLERETQILSNGAVGINFHNPSTGKPANLQKSAVLRMLEEEESRQRNGFGAGNDSISRNTTWPPPEYEHKNKLRSTFKDVVVPGAKRVAWPPPNDSDSPLVEQDPVSAQGGPQYPSQSPGLQQNNHHQPLSHQQRPSPSNQTHQRAPLKPLEVSPGATSPLASPLLNQTPQAYRPSTPAKGWAPVLSPVATPTQPPSWPQQTASAKFQSAHQSVSQQSFVGQQYQPSLQPVQQPKPVPSQFQSPPKHQPAQSPQPQFNAPQYAPKLEVAPSQATRPVVEPPPSTITLRPKAPVSQAPPPVFSSQPATATLKGGKHLRGDLKWPPENVKSQAEEENRLRLELARGPVFRPKRPNKDYTEFFAQHALNSTYPGYRIPPGTQFIKPE